MKFYNNVLELIGNTPLVRINNITKEHKIRAQVYAKMESLNPGYSVKDRIGLSMVDWAEEKGVLKKGGTIIEATSAIPVSALLLSQRYAATSASLFSPIRYRSKKTVI